MRCDLPGCPEPPLFEVFAIGYPASMARSCPGHLGAVVERDVSRPGSTKAWIVRVREAVGDGNCELFADVDFGRGPVEVRCTQTGEHDDHRCEVRIAPAGLPAPTGG